MSQRRSGYKRKRNDLYVTPDWVTEVVAAHLARRVKRIWEPAAGNRKMQRALKRCGFIVFATDITRRRDFLTTTMSKPFEAIVTNPPFRMAIQFIERALELTRRVRGQVAMLLRVDFDSAGSRRYLFAEHPAFAMKITLTQRIKWFARSKGSPSYNHAWFVWDWRRTSNAAVMAWAP